MMMIFLQPDLLELSFLIGLVLWELLYSKTIFIEDKAHGKSYTKAIDVDEQLLQRDGQAQRMGDCSTLILSAEPQGAAAVVLNTTNGNLIYNVITGTLVKESAITDHSKEGF